LFEEGTQGSFSTAGLDSHLWGYAFYEVRDEERIKEETYGRKQNSIEKLNDRLLVGET
jgi:hypothetical protein